jgi:hypothetical protein
VQKRNYRTIHAGRHGDDAHSHDRDRRSPGLAAATCRFLLLVADFDAGRRLGHLGPAVLRGVAGPEMPVDHAIWAAFANARLILQE